MTQSNKASATRRDANTASIKEGGLPKDAPTARSGDNRRGGDLDGNRRAAKAKKPR
jgi:hypothetical protein